VAVDIDPELVRLLRDQDGVVGRWQTRDPATLARMDRRLHARKWPAPYIGVYVAPQRSAGGGAEALGCRAGLR
jgi:hypothetical protein